MQFSSINFICENFIYSDRVLKFHNHILENETGMIDDYSKIFIKNIKDINLMNFNDVKEKIDTIKNADVLESNADIEVTVQIMKKYGFSERFIIKEMLGGDNIRKIDYYSKKDKTYNTKSPNLIDFNSRILLKFPLKINSKNKVRLIVLIIKNKVNKKVYPLYLDIHHYLYSSNNYIEIPKNKIIFENEFSNKILSCN